LADAEEVSMTASETFEAIRVFGEHEHRELTRGISHIHEAATFVGVASHVEVRRATRDVLAWAGTTLEPHLAWEETWLYPQIELATGTPWSTRAARFDHGQLAALIARLRLHEATASHLWTTTTTTELRFDLVALEALLRAHMEREERLLLPVLDELQHESPPGP
jgi:hypothetical protein